MPVIVIKRGPKYRIVESKSRRILKTSKNKAVDGGGHTTLKSAKAQARAINASL